MKKLKNISLVFLVIFCTNAFCSSPRRVEISIQTVGDIDEEIADINSFKWYYELEENNKIEVSGFFSSIRKSAENNKAVQIINILAGNPYHNDFKDNNHHGLYFLDIMPANDLKRQILKTLGQIADLAKNGNVERIISFTNNVIPKNSDKHRIGCCIQLSEIFPIERKNSLNFFFIRMKDHAGRGNLYELYNISILVKNDNFVKAYDMFTDMTSYEYLNSGDKKLYDLRASIKNLEDFGAGYRSFEIWKRHINNLLSTLNLGNKQLILELLSYAKTEDYSESNFWQNNVYFKPRIQRVVGEIFPAARLDIPDGCLRCDGSEHQVSQYKYFVNKYLKTGRVPVLTFAAWEQQFKDQANNCGFFGYDEGSATFKAPRIKTGTFLTNGSYSDAGTFGWDQIVNITGCLFQYQDRSIGLNASSEGAFYATNNCVGWCHFYKTGTEQPSVFRFDASRVVRTGDKVQPRNIRYPFL